MLANMMLIKSEAGDDKLPFFRFTKTCTLPTIPISVIEIPIQIKECSQNITANVFHQIGVLEADN